MAAVWGAVLLSGIVGLASGHDVRWREGMTLADDRDIVLGPADDDVDGGAEVDAAVAAAGETASLAAELEEGDWRGACHVEGGKTVTFDRASVRVLGRRRLFRWALTDEGAVPAAAWPVHTALANCADNTLEPTWPGPRVPTGVRSGGRLLVQAVCAVPSSARRTASRRGPHGPAAVDPPRSANPHAR